jgi:multidrug efflux pump subunit AcrB
VKEQIPLGLSGRLTSATIGSPLTPLLLLAALAMGLIALFAIPREEEPQISVPMVDIIVPSPGLKAQAAADLVGVPLEGIVKGIRGVDHVYTQAMDDMVMVTARFAVGADADDAATRISERIQANWQRRPAGIGDPQVALRGIDDVPMLVLTLSPGPGMAARWPDTMLREVAERLLEDLSRVEDVGPGFVTGGRSQVLHVAPDPAKLAAHGVTLPALAQAVQAADRAIPAGTLLDSGTARAATAGARLPDAAALANLTVRNTGGQPVLLSDVARVGVAPRPGQPLVWRWARDDAGQWTRNAAVSIALSKRPGANAVVVADAVLARVEDLKGEMLPSSLSVAVTRNYGETASEKANELLFHLGLATVSIVALIAIAIGRREAMVTAIVIPTTILLTLFAAWVMGYTINRVSLFALIFSIGILVDDAIVMIENIARHWAMNDGRSRVQGVIDAVAEVGNPTVIATLTVVAALLPMLFVSGLMGPYMAPIPVNASAAMLFSFFVAVVIAPWAMLKLAGNAPAHGHEDAGGGKLGQLFRSAATRIITDRGTARRFLWVVGLATVAACSLFYFKAVTVKLLPFDNKSEVQVVVDLPEGAAREATARVLEQVAGVARTLPEVAAMEAHAGTSAPYNFNGLVRHSFLRRLPEQGDVMIALAHGDERDRASHDVALDLRERLAKLPLPAGTSVKVVETPPGPPVMATLLAEIHGPDPATRQRTAEEVEKLFRQVPFIVDVDTSMGAPRPRLELVPRRDRIDALGLEEGQLKASIALALGETVLGQVPRSAGQPALPILLALDDAERRLAGGGLLSLPVAAARDGRSLDLGGLVEARSGVGERMIFRRDGRPADMVMAELAGAYEAPVYGVLEINRLVNAHDWAKAGLKRPAISFHAMPEGEATTLLWDGEWEITWVTFRDMGAAFGVALIGIYMLVVGQFGSFRLPLVILVPVPLTLIGIVIGHWIFGAPFTATSMIGFIALAGIIVRNTILLVDFIRHAKAPGKPLRQVLIEAGSIRVKPIVLTAAAAMIGAATILTDPIFQGLAISLLFGLASSTLLTLLVIPAIYVVLRDDGLAVDSAAPATRH